MSEYPAARGSPSAHVIEVVDHVAHRLQFQERLTTQVADTLMRELMLTAVGVRTEAQHLCMTMRGIKRPGSQLVTLATRTGERLRGRAASGNSRSIERLTVMTSQLAD